MKEKDPRIVTIFYRNSRDAKVKRKCLALLTLATEKNITFSTKECVPPAVDLHYYLKIGLPEESQDKFREIYVYIHPGKEPPYIYTVELGQEWSGFLETEE